MLHQSVSAVMFGRPRPRASLTTAAVAASVAAVGLLMVRLVSGWRQRRRLRAAIAEKRSARQRAKADFASYLARQAMSDAEEAEIASLPARQLVERLRTGRLKPNRVLLAFQRRAFRIDKRLNCVAEFLTPDLAEVNLNGPLAGLPVSVKENFSLKGRDSCIGCAAFIGQPWPEDCLAVRQLKALGGVPFVRTVVPQTMLTVLSTNPIDGTVRNPANLARSPGGSSSGEGALIAAGGSPLGLGSDIGGSIRTPASWCGAAGLKPTSGRLTRMGMRGAALQRMVEPAWGPMAPDVDALALFMEAVAAGTERGLLPPALVDPTLPPIGLQYPGVDDVSEAASVPRRLTIAYMVTHGQMRAAPCMERAVLLTRDLLAAQGHRLVLWNSPASLTDFPIVETYARSVWSDGGSYVQSVIRHDVVSVSITNVAMALGVPACLRGNLAACYRRFGNADVALGMGSLGGVDSVHELWRYAQRTQDRREAFMAEWQQRGFDALICPANGTPAPPIDDPRVTMPCLAYNVLFNLFNMPAGVVQVTKVTQTDLDSLRSAEGVGWTPNLLAMQPGSLGLPVAVQCAAMPWREDVCLRVMREVEAAVASAASDQ